MPPTKRKAIDEVVGHAAKRSTTAPSTPQRISDDSDSDFDNAFDEDGDILDLNEESKERAEKASVAIRNLTNRTLFSKLSKNVKQSALFGNKDFHGEHLKPDHENRPLWLDARVTDGSIKGPKITLESWSPNAQRATDLLITIAEPVSRPAHFHEYRINEHSLYAALSVGLKGDDIINALDKFSKTAVPEEIKEFIRRNTLTYGKVRLVLKDNRFWVESEDNEVIFKLLADPTINSCKAEGAQVETGSVQTKGAVIQGTVQAKGLTQNAPEVRRDDPVAEQERMIAALRDEDDDDDAFRTTHAFELAPNKREIVAQRCLELGLPAVSEYDFNNDKVNSPLPIDLKPQTQIRPYQEKALSKMFGNGRGKSGIIVLPCGAGKTLVGITAACHIKKSVVVLCTSGMSVRQWGDEFKKWSDTTEDQIARFSSAEKKKFSGDAGVLISTYSMMCMDPDRSKCSHETEKMLRWVRSREWGLMILDEVHVVPAKTFRAVTDGVRAHCKLGLTATLLREDDKIADLNYLIGPKLYEANWMELSNQGHIAKVQCAEVWCPMSMEFYQEYVKAPRGNKQTLWYACNPVKFQVCQYLINYHESRGDKIIVFSDNIFALQHYATEMGKPMIHGGTSEAERQIVLTMFRNSDTYSTIFLSKIGDTSLDLPEATCLIQVSSHYASRRQEAQRLGRILRAKRRSQENFNAFFYSLVSKDTSEMLYSAKRQSFLVDQGYAFKTITHLSGMDQLPGLKYRDRQERLELLQKVILKADTEGGIDAGDKENNWGRLNVNSTKSGGKKVGPNVKRTAGQLSEMAGGGIMAPIYEERKRGSKKNDADPNSFFSKQRRQRENRLKKEAAQREQEAKEAAKQAERRNRPRDY